MISDDLEHYFEDYMGEALSPGYPRSRVEFQEQVVDFLSALYQLGLDAGNCRPGELMALVDEAVGFEAVEGKGTTSTRVTSPTPTAKDKGLEADS